MTKKAMKAMKAYAAGNALYKTVIEGVADAMAQEIGAFTEDELEEYGERLDSAYESAAELINKNYDAVQKVANQKAAAYRQEFQQAVEEQQAAEFQQAAYAITMAEKEKAAKKTAMDMADVIAMELDEMSGAGTEENSEALKEISEGVYLVRDEIADGNIQEAREDIYGLIDETGKILDASYKTGDVETEMMFEKAFAALLDLYRATTRIYG